jgi:hypothetical protein
MSKTLSKKKPKKVAGTTRESTRTWRKKDQKIGRRKNAWPLLDTLTYSLKSSLWIKTFTYSQDARSSSAAGSTTPAATTGRALNRGFDFGKRQEDPAPAPTSSMMVLMLVGVGAEVASKVESKSVQKRCPRRSVGEKNDPTEK